VIPAACVLSHVVAGKFIRVEECVLQVSETAAGRAEAIEALAPRMPPSAPAF